MVRDKNLRSYNAVFNFCKEDSPVYFTRKGHSKYMLIDIEDYEKVKATLKLMAHIEEGEKSAREDGWISSDNIESELGLKVNIQALNIQA